ncbi:MAG: baseplate J/gp47 family protein [Bacteroidota bacterium]
MTAEDRLQALLEQTEVTGIDFTYVHSTQVRLDVYFFLDPATLDVSPIGSLLEEQIRIRRASDNQLVEIDNFEWNDVDGQNVLTIYTIEPGDFSRYLLSLVDPVSGEDVFWIDPYYNNYNFTFKANCPSDLDCKLATRDCPPEDVVDYPVNYLARDFWSYRQALLDFASDRYPDWKDRLAPDGGMMLVEVMSALADEMAYTQDRINREAYLETATQRRSVKEHAALVDYHMHDGAGAQTWLQIMVRPGLSGALPAGLDVSTLNTNGLQLTFELGRGLAEYDSDLSPGATYFVDADRNELYPHCWDEDDLCLKHGSTSVYLDGHHQNTQLPLADDPAQEHTGKWVLLATYPEPGVPARRHLVWLTRVENRNDPVFDRPITYIEWEDNQALPFDMDMAVLRVHANIVPATAGRMHTSYFAVDAVPESIHADIRADVTIERLGPEGNPLYRYSLPQSQENPLVWLGSDSQNLHPEVRLTQINPADGQALIGGLWTWRRSLVRDFASQSQDEDYTMENGTWKRVVGYQRIGEEIVHKDYASDAGHTIRFGDGEFGAIPAGGTTFRVDYRLGGGRRTNIAANTLRTMEDPLGIIESVTNPLAATYGLEPEPIYQVRQLAPEAFKAVTYRAVRPEDYAEAAERLTWVQRAGANFRWTGSWLSAFVTPDPVNSTVISPEQRTALTEQLDRFRQTGREAHVMDPIYADMDLEITLCAKSSSYAGEVKAAVQAALLGNAGFFSSDNFTFGTPLRRSALEARIQNVPGVEGVQRIRFRRRGWFSWRPFIQLSYNPGGQTIIRLENDPRFPERGSLKLTVNGGI